MCAYVNVDVMELVQIHTPLFYETISTSKCQEMWIVCLLVQTCNVTYPRLVLLNQINKRVGQCTRIKDSLMGTPNVCSHW